jgi:hypothetical protein
MEERQRYEYEFVYIDLKWLSKEPKHDYHRMINDYAKQGWRLFQIFAPNVAGFGEAAYFELIFERPLASTPS